MVKMRMVEWRRKSALGKGEVVQQRLKRRRRRMWGHGGLSGWNEHSGDGPELPAEQSAW
jgi:hypothetical protein